MEWWMWSWCITSCFSWASSFFMHVYICYLFTFAFPTLEKNGQVLILATPIPLLLWLILRLWFFFFSLGRKPSCDSAYDSITQLCHQWKSALITGHQDFSQKGVLCIPLYGKLMEKLSTCICTCIIFMVKTNCLLDKYYFVPSF